MTYKIAIAGKAGSGKSTFAKLLAKGLPEFAIIPFAKPLKKIALDMGCCIDKDIWVKKWLEEAYRLGVAFVIADDCRFDNEAQAADFVILLTGREGECRAHQSEAGISKEYVDAVMPNKWDENWLANKASHMASKIVCLAYKERRNEEARKD